jgi:hypothetical protein
MSGGDRAARRAAHAAAFAARWRIKGEPRPLLLASRGAPGLAWYEDARLGRRRLVDVYAENLPEALIDWAGRNGRRVYVLYVGRRPDFDARSPSYETLHGDLVREIDLADFRRGWPADRDAAERFEAHYRDALLSRPDLRALFRVEGVDLFDSLADQIALTPRLAAAHVARREMWADLLGALAPDALFGGRLDVSLDICAAAADAGVMSVSVKLGVGEEMMAPFAVGDREGRFDAAALPDVAAVWGARQKAAVEARFPGLPCRLIACGRTRNDSFAPLPGAAAPDPAPAGAGAGGADGADAAGAVRAALGLAPGTELIVYGANHMTRYGAGAGDAFGAPCMALGSWRAFLRALLDVARARPSAAVVVKPHPSDDLATLAAAVEAEADPRLLFLTDAAGFHNAQLLREAAVFASSPSSMFSEALLAGALPIDIWTPDVNYLYETGREAVFSGVSLTARTPDDAAAIARRALEDPGFRAAETARLSQGLEAIFGGRDGLNAARLVAESMAYHAAVWAPARRAAARG